MGLDEALRQAIASDDPKRLESVVDSMRLRYGWNYDRCRAAALTWVPGLTAADWESFLLRIDNGDPTLR
jgi:hypothetical protein